MGEAKQRGTRAERVAAATRRDDLPRIRAEAQIGVAKNGRPKTSFWKTTMRNLASCWPWLELSRNENSVFDRSGFG